MRIANPNMPKPGIRTSTPGKQDMPPPPGMPTMPPPPNVGPVRPPPQNILVKPPQGKPPQGMPAGAPPPSGGTMDGIRNAVRQAAQAIPKSTVPPPGAPRGTISAGMPPQGGRVEGNYRGIPNLVNATAPMPKGAPISGNFPMQQPVGGASTGMGALLNAGRTGGMGMKKGGMVSSKPKASSASSRGDGFATKGKTKGRFV